MISITNINDKGNTTTTISDETLLKAQLHKEFFLIKRERERGRHRE